MLDVYYVKMEAKVKRNVKISHVRMIGLNADELVSKLLTLYGSERLALLDSCGVGHLGSHLLIAGIRPVETVEIRDRDPGKVLEQFERRLSAGLAAVFTISYDLGPKLQLGAAVPPLAEPDIFITLFESLVVHDYADGSTSWVGKPNDELYRMLIDQRAFLDNGVAASGVESNFTRGSYIEAVETIKDYIRDGHTYQANLTQRLTVATPRSLSPAAVFRRLRRDHPAPFAAFIDRGNSSVVSASPERFFKIAGRDISASPIKGTRPRGRTPSEDEALRTELLTSAKDRAENTMIVDLLRNDLGRVCDFGTVTVERLCELEQHPTLFHLVSTIRGRLREDVSISEVLSSLFPCGSITGAPKIRTMGIIDKIEDVPRGLSMGAIGYFIPANGFEPLEPVFDCSVAIRTIVFADDQATFSVGGGITIDSDPEAEYEESMLKAKALLNALGNKPA